VNYVTKYASFTDLFRTQREVGTKSIDRLRNKNEVGVVLPDGASYCSLIRPAPHWIHWDPRAEQLHRITPQLLAAHGKAPGEVSAILNQRLRGHVVYSDG
jgi:hypothetical protein